MSPSRLTVEVWPATDAGQAEENEDYVLVYQPDDPTLARYAGSLYVVTDGQGGGGRGQMASRYAAQKVMNAYYASDEPDLGLRLREAVRAANADLFAYAQQRPELVKLNTTLVAAAIRGEEMHVAAVGDSRAYLVREGGITRLTRDHTLVQQLVDEGAIGEDEAAEHPRRDVVLRTLGALEDVTVDVYDSRLRPDDVLVLCSDGITRALHDDEIAQIAGTSAPQSAAETLVQKAADRGIKDNVTAIAALMRDGAPPIHVDVPYQWDGQPPSFDEQPTLAMPRVERAPEPTPAPQSAETLVSAPPPVEQPPAPAPVAPPSTGVVPAPPYQQPIQPAPPYAGQQEQPAPQQPGSPQQPAYPQQPPPPQPAYPPPPTPQQPQYGQRGVPGGYAPPPGYAIDPVTGLSPVPSQPGPDQQGYPPQQSPGYQPRVYQPPAQPQYGPVRRGGGGISVGLFALVGLLAIVLTAAMVVVLINPLGWQLPFGIGSAPAAPGATQPVAEATQAPTSAVAEQPTVETAPQPTVAPTPTAALAPAGMVLVDGGAFTRGVPDAEALAAVQTCIQETVNDLPQQHLLCRDENYYDAQPVESVTISPFYIDITEVTNAAYTQCVDAGGCTAPSNTEFYADPAYSQHPVVYVNWQQAVDYCTWSAKRLPTEAEWEKAARWDPSTQTSYTWPWGNDWEPQRANTASAELGGLSAVQAFPRDLSPWGVLDMAGNVSEWVQDWYYGDYKGLGTLNPVRNGVQPLPTAARGAHGGSFQSILVAGSRRTALRCPAAERRAVARLPLRAGRGRGHAARNGHRCAGRNRDDARGHDHSRAG